MIATVLFAMLLGSAPTPAVPDSGVPAAAPGQVVHEIQLTPVAVPATGPVALHVEHGRNQGTVGPGFLLQVDGWAPAGHLAVRMVGPKGEIVQVIADDQNMQVQPDGKASALVPYKLQGLFPGAWELQVGGASGVHVVAVQIPVVEPPNASHRTSRLVFPGAAKGAKPWDLPEAVPATLPSR